MITSLNPNSEYGQDASHSRRRAFTLIELLTVIAIIGILAAIIIPVTGKVRATARKTKCLSATRQIGIAFLAHAGDHNDTFPVQINGALTAADPQSWVQQIGHYTDGYLVFPCSEYRPKPGDPFATGHRMYNAYVSRNKFPNDQAPTRISQSTAPGRDVLMIEQIISSNLNASTVVDWPNSNSWWHYPHPGSGRPVDPTHSNNIVRCVLYVDGHVNQRPIGGIPNENWYDWPKRN